MPALPRGPAGDSVLTGSTCSPPARRGVEAGTGPAVLDCVASRRPRTRSTACGRIRIRPIGRLPGSSLPASPSGGWPASSRPSVTSWPCSALARGVRAGFEPGRDSRALERFVHRSRRGQDIAAACTSCAACWTPPGPSKGSSWRPRPGVAGYRRRPRVVLRPRQECGHPACLRPPPGRAARRPCLFPLPSAGSAGKRLNLFLRWTIAGTRLTSGHGRARHRRASSSRSTCTSSEWGSASA